MTLSCSRFQAKFRSSSTRRELRPTYSINALENTLAGRISLWSWTPHCTPLPFQSLYGVEVPKLRLSVDWSRHTAFLPYGERWKHQRQLMHTSFRKTVAHKYWQGQTRHARQAAARMLERPEEFVAELTRYVPESIYGHLDLIYLSWFVLGCPARRCYRVPMATK